MGMRPRGSKGFRGPSHHITPAIPHLNPNAHVQQPQDQVQEPSLGPDPLHDKERDTDKQSHKDIHTPINRDQHHAQDLQNGQPETLQHKDEHRHQGQVEKQGDHHHEESNPHEDEDQQPGHHHHDEGKGNLKEGPQDPDPLRQGKQRCQPRQEGQRPQLHHYHEDLDSGDRKQRRASGGRQYILGVRAILAVLLAGLSFAAGALSMSYIMNPLSGALVHHSMGPSTHATIHHPPRHTSVSGVAHAYASPFLTEATEQTLDQSFGQSNTQPAYVVIQHACFIYRMQRSGRAPHVQAYWTGVHLYRSSFPNGLANVRPGHLVHACPRCQHIKLNAPDVEEMLAEGHVVRCHSFVCAEEEARQHGPYQQQHSRLSGPRGV